MNIENTPFGKLVSSKKVKTVVETSGDDKINFHLYQLAVHKSNLRIFSIGMKLKGITLKQLKDYYGLKGRSAKDALNDFLSKYDSFKTFIKENN